MHSTTSELANAVAATGYAIWPDFVDGQQLKALRREASGLLDGPHARHYPKSTRVWDLRLHENPFVTSASTR